jgi:hypothetical protein
MLIRLYVGRRRMNTPLSILAFLGLASPLVLAAAGPSRAAELVRFESAGVPLSEFQQKRAKARGEVLEPQKGDAIQAFVVKPSGKGPHPVIVYLPDCGGLAPM